MSRFGSTGLSREVKETIEGLKSQQEVAQEKTEVVQSGLSVISSDQPSSLDVKMEGRTLISLGNSALSKDKQYILNSGNVSVDFSNGTSFKGVTKFKSPLSEKPSISLLSDYKGKVQGSVVANGAKYNRRGSAILGSPNDLGTGGWYEPSQDAYNSLMNLDNALESISTSTAGNMIQVMHSFDVLQIIEKYFCKVPGATLSEKVSWARVNLEKMVINWYGRGSSNDVNKATIRLWNHTNQAWGTGMPNNTKPTVEKVNMYTNDPRAYIDNNGYCHLIAYAEPATEGKTSRVDVDYVEILLTPKFPVDAETFLPLYEISQSEYDKAFVTWNEAEVNKRFPVVQGMRHVENPQVEVKGINLLPPFTEWSLDANARVIEPYKAELNKTASGQYITLDIPIVIGETYTFQMEGNGSLYPDLRDSKGVRIETLGYYRWGTPLTFTVTNPEAKYVRIALTGENQKLTFSNGFLKAGVGGEFSPMSKSNLLLSSTLRSLGVVKDVVSKRAGKFVVDRKIGQVDLPSTQWYYEGELVGAKKIAIRGLYLTGTLGMKIEHDTYRLVYKNGKVFRNETYTNRDSGQGIIYNGNSTFVVVLPNAETGWVDGTEPTVSEIATFFSNNPLTLFYTLDKTIQEDVNSSGAISILGESHIKVTAINVPPVDIAVNFSGSIKSTINQVVEEQTVLKANDSSFTQSLVEVYKQLNALGGS